MYICACLLGCFLISHIQTGSRLSFIQVQIQHDSSPCRAQTQPGPLELLKLHFFLETSPAQAPPQPHITQSQLPGTLLGVVLLEGRKRSLTHQVLHLRLNFPPDSLAGNAGSYQGCFSIPFSGLISPGQRLLEEAP